VLAFAVAMAQAAPKDEVTEAAKKLSEKGNYSWTTKSENAAGGGGGGQGGGGRFRAGPTEGKHADGTTYLSVQRGDNTTEVVLKGDKGAIKTQDGWQSLSELGGEGAQGLGRFMANQYRNFKAPAAQAQEIIGLVKEVKKEGDAYTGELTEEGVKSLMAFGGGRRGGQGGGQGPEVSGGKGTAKFWVKDGALAKYEYNVQGSMTFGDNERQINRTTTVEIKDIGTTKVEVPSEAKEKLS
jgi:hypothetical protein